MLWSHEKQGLYNAVITWKSKWSSIKNLKSLFVHNSRWNFLKRSKGFWVERIDTRPLSLGWFNEEKKPPAGIQPCSRYCSWNCLQGWLGPLKRAMKGRKSWEQNYPTAAGHNKREKLWALHKNIIAANNFILEKSLWPSKCLLMMCPLASLVGAGCVVPPFCQLWV